MNYPHDQENETVNILAPDAHSEAVAAVYALPDLYEHAMRLSSVTRDLLKQVELEVSENFDSGRPEDVLMHRFLEEMTELSSAVAKAAIEIIKVRDLLEW